jgi:antitoxin component YwqK of YwqJK toxin-antitoxin module
MNGSIRYKATYVKGHKTDSEILWDEEGRKVWMWLHDGRGKGTWTKYYSNGQMKSQSVWKNSRANGTARIWSMDGELIGDVIFDNGRVK